MANNKKKKNETARKQIKTTPFYIALVVIFILFIFFQGSKNLSSILGIVLFIMIIIVIIIELTNGIKEEGLTRNLLEIVIAVVLVLVFWYGLKFFLQTSNPLDIVPSCSMLPNLQRGDMIVLHGISNIKQINAPTINVNNSVFSNTESNIQNEFLSCVAYNDTNGRVSLSQLIKPGYSIGLLLQNQQGSQIIQQQDQGNNLIKYACGAQEIKYSNGSTAQEAYTTSVSINGTIINNDKNNSIVVYQTIPQDYFYKLGDTYIVHRVYAIINVSGVYYVLTKGDNNPGLDLQYGNYPINLTYIQGKEILSIPYLGYIKLVLSNSFTEPSGCNSTVVNN